MLCSQRHCIFAISYEHPEMSDEYALKAAQGLWKEIQDKKLVNPWCALCDGRDMYFECGETGFRTMKEAMPHLKEEEIRQLKTQLRLLAERN